MLPFAPDTALGSPHELKSMIDTAHGLGLSVMLDVVYNHFGPDGAYIHAFAKPFFREDIKTPWGASIDFRRPEVRDYFEQNAYCIWLNEYWFDGLRFDAVHAISEEDFLVEIAERARAATPGRHIALVLEHENNRAALLGGPPQFDAQWADDMHHCLHVLLTHEDEGYYEDFQEATDLLVRALEGGFAYQGEVSPHLGRPRGEPSTHLPTTAFVICLQNHDQIGNRAMGERLTTLAPRAALDAATAFLLLSPFIRWCSWARNTPARRRSCSSPAIMTSSPSWCARAGAPSSRRSPRSRTRRGGPPSRTRTPPGHTTRRAPGRRTRIMRTGWPRCWRCGGTT